MCVPLGRVSESYRYGYACMCISAHACHFKMCLCVQIRRLRPRACTFSCQGVHLCSVLSREWWWRRRRAGGCWPSGRLQMWGYWADRPGPLWAYVCQPQPLWLSSSPFCGLVLVYGQRIEQESERYWTIKMRKIKRAKNKKGWREKGNKREMVS